MCMHCLRPTYQVHSEEIGIPSYPVHLHQVVTEEGAQVKGRCFSAVLSSSDCSQHKTQACKQGADHLFFLLCFSSCQAKNAGKCTCFELVVNASSCPCCALNTSRSSIFLPFHFCVSCRNQCGNVVDRARGFAIPCTSPYSMEEASWNGKKPCMTFSIRHFAKRCLHAVP